eukprot:m.88962 g.88962  ORF g.88962 m.88962 type:complete len:307 (-) comp12872_c0_seq5:169-1089(-)
MIIILLERCCLEFFEILRNLTHFLSFFLMFAQFISSFLSKVIVVGPTQCTMALVINRCCPSIPAENITAVTNVHQRPIVSRIVKYLNGELATQDPELSVFEHQIAQVAVWGGDDSTTQIVDLDAVVATDVGAVVGDGTQTLLKHIVPDSKTRAKFLGPSEDDVAARAPTPPYKGDLCYARAAEAHLSALMCGTASDQFLSMGVILTESHPKVATIPNLCLSCPVKVSPLGTLSHASVAISDDTAQRIRMVSHQLALARFEAFKHIGIRVSPVPSPKPIRTQKADQDLLGHEGDEQGEEDAEGEEGK